MEPALTDLIGASLAAGLASPLWLALAGLVVPLAVLWMIHPNPRELELPTLQFLHREEGTDESTPAFERMPRSLIMVLQALIILLLAAALAAPYVSVGEASPASETVIVVDASASMATETGDGTRFERAITAARASTTEETTLVVAGDEVQVLLEEGAAASATQLLGEVQIDHTDTDLGAAIAQGAALADGNARVVVFSDFAGGQEWTTPVQVARARERTVALRQFDGGGADNVGIVERTFEDGSVSASVRNFGSETVERTVSIGDATQTVTLEPGDTGRVRLPVPTNGGTLALETGDSFPVDDRVPVAAPSTQSTEVLLLTNDPDRHLRTALQVMKAVDLTVQRPPTSFEGSAYDVVVFGNVTPDRLLDGTVDSARTTLRTGGGVAVVARNDTPSAGLGNLMLLEDTERRTDGEVEETANVALTEGITFPDPEAYLGGSLARGQALVRTSEGSPLVARGVVAGGPVLQTSYLGTVTALERHFMYPVFWKRAVADLSGRPTLAELNHPTGATLFTDNRTVTLPDGTEFTGSPEMVDTGVYQVGQTRHAAALLDPTESGVAADGIEAASVPASEGGDGTDSEPYELGPLLFVAGAAVAAIELAVLALEGSL